MSYIPLNWKLIGNPVNWAIILLMLFFASFIINFINPASE